MSQLGNAVVRRVQYLELNFVSFLVGDPTNKTTGFQTLKACIVRLPVLILTRSFKGELKLETNVVKVGTKATTRQVPHILQEDSLGSQNTNCTEDFWK